MPYNRKRQSQLVQSMDSNPFAVHYKVEERMVSREERNENINCQNQPVAAVHFYPQQKEQGPVRKSHPLRQEKEELAFEKKRRSSFANSTTRSRGSSMRKSSNSIKGDRFIPMRGTDPFQYEHALLRA